MKIFTILLSFSLFPSLSAQVVGQKDKPKYSVSIVCVGNRSDSYWVGEGAKMKAIAYDKGATPPPNLSLATSEKKEKNKDLRTALNAPSPHVTISSSICRLKSKSVVEGKILFKDYASVQLPEKVVPYSVIMSRPPRAKNWDKPKLLTLSDALDDFPLGSVRVMNVSDRTVLVYLDGKAVSKLEPGKSGVLKGILSGQASREVALAYMHNSKKALAMRRRFEATTRRLNIACFYALKKEKPVLASIFQTPEPKGGATVSAPVVAPTQVEEGE